MKVSELRNKIQMFELQDLGDAYVVLTQEEMNEFTRQFPHEDVICLEQHIPMFLPEVNEDLPDDEQA